MECCVAMVCWCTYSPFYCESVFLDALINSAVHLANIHLPTIKAGNIIHSQVFEMDSAFSASHEWPDSGVWFESCPDVVLAQYFANFFLYCLSMSKCNCSGESVVLFFLWWRSVKMLSWESVACSVYFSVCSSQVSVLIGHCLWGRATFVLRCSWELGVVPGGGVFASYVLCVQGNHPPFSLWEHQGRVIIHCLLLHGELNVFVQGVRCKSGRWENWTMT